MGEIHQSLVYIDCPPPTTLTQDPFSSKYDVIPFRIKQLYTRGIPFETDYGDHPGSISRY